MSQCCILDAGAYGGSQWMLYDGIGCWRLGMRGTGSLVVVVRYDYDVGVVPVGGVASGLIVKRRISRTRIGAVLCLWGFGVCFTRCEIELRKCDVPGMICRRVVGRVNVVEDIDDWGQRSEC